jgi:Pyrimidine operon attenuation protein/uracil phosphoribosyltransferase
MGRTRIMSPERVRRTLRRLAYEIIEHNRGAESLELFGIRRSGVPPARVVADEIGEVEEQALEPYDLDVTPFRDDRPDLAPPEETPHDVDVTDRDVILVDDVVFTGRTARAALDAVLQSGARAAFSSSSSLIGGTGSIPSSRTSPAVASRRSTTRRWSWRPTASLRYM